MAHLTKPTKYDIKDSNIALLGSDLEKRVREHAGDNEPAWQNAGLEPGLQIWRIEKFKVVEWPKDRTGSFYNGDSYIILHTYKKSPEAKSLSYDLHFWLGEDTSQDEAGTAAYKTVELDDHLHGVPIQYREVQCYESTRFLSYFPRFLCLRGGVASGFHHVSTPPPLHIRKLYRIGFGHGRLVIHEVVPDASSLVQGDVFVLDKGSEVWQFNTKASLGREKFKAAEFVRELVDSRKGQCKLTVYDEGGKGAGVFLSEFGLAALPPERGVTKVRSDVATFLYRLSDATGTLTFEPVAPPALTTLSTDDAFLLDASKTAIPAVYVWIGKLASRLERRMSLQYAQNYVHQKVAAGEGIAASVSIVKVNEGEVSDAFVQAIERG